VAKNTAYVFAAASLKPPFDKIADEVLRDQSTSVGFNYAGTQTLVAQLMEGAQADVFASADIAHMTTLQDAGLLDGTPRVFAHNRLEVAVEKGNPKKIHGLADLARTDLTVVLADPSVPAGKYAQQALARANITVHPASLEPQVTGVLSKVALGEADAGIVYVSDIVTSGKVDGVTIPDSQNVITDYPIAKLKSAQNKDGANSFLSYVFSGQGQTTLRDAGFQGA
jgi:molybdate transport system substrate-binding protein